MPIPVGPLRALEAGAKVPSVARREAGRSLARAPRIGGEYEPTWAGTAQLSREAALERRIALHKEWMKLPQQEMRLDEYMEVIGRREKGWQKKRDGMVKEDYGLLEKTEGNLSVYMVKPPTRGLDDAHLQRLKAGLGTVFGEKQLEMGEATIRKGYEMFRKEGMAKLPVAPMKDWVHREPAVMAPLHDKLSEAIWDGVSNGTLNLYAPPKKKDGKPNPEYIRNEWVMAYTQMARERSAEGFDAHPHYKVLRQRLGEMIASKGGKIWREKLAAGFSAALPTGKQTSQELQGEYDEGKYDATPGLKEMALDRIKNARDEEEVLRLMELAGEGAGTSALIGTFIGAFGTSASLYSNLTKMGLTKFIRVDAKSKIKSLMATGAAELGIDAMYNPEGYSMVLGYLMDESQGNRVLSGTEAMLLGTAFNLGADAWRVFKGKPRRVVMKELSERVTEQEWRDIERLQDAAKRDVVKHMKVSAREQIESTLPPIRSADPISATRADDLAKAVQKKAEIAAWHMKLDLEEAVTTLEAELRGGPLSPSGDPKGVGMARRKARGAKMVQLKKTKDELEKLSDSQNMDVTPMDMMDELDVKNTVMATRQGAVGGVAEKTVDEALKTVDAAFPERPITYVDALLDNTGEEIFGISRASVKAALKMKLKGEMTEQDYRKYAVHSGFGGIAVIDPEEDEEIAAYLMGFATLIAAGSTFKRWGPPLAKKYLESTPVGPAGKFFSKALVPFSSQLWRISPRVWWWNLKSSMATQIKTHNRLGKAAAFFTHMDDYVERGWMTLAEKREIYKQLDEGARTQVYSEGAKKFTSELTAVRKMDEIDFRLDNPDVRGATRRVFEEYESVVRGIGKQANDMGLLSYILPDYFPRSIKPSEYKRFLKDAGIKNDSRIKAAWKSEKDAKGGRDLTDQEKVSIANAVIINYGYAGKGMKPSFLQKRVYDVVPEHMRQYYNTFEESSLAYIMHMTEYVDNSQLLGVGLKKARLKDIMEATEARQFAAALGGVPVEKVAFPKYASKPYDYRVTIGDQLRKIEPHVNDEQLEWLTELLHKRYATPNGRPAWTWVKWLRDISYSGAIGNPYSTMTQLSDSFLTASLSSRGWGKEVMDSAWGQAARKLTGGKPTYTLADFGIDAKGLQRMLAEFEDEALTTKWLRFNLNKVGFSAVDVFGKQTLLNATYKELRAAAKAPRASEAYKRFELEYLPAQGTKEFKNFVKALNAGDKMNDSVMGAIYARLLGQHPIGKDAMPLHYAKHPHARVMYQLSSFTIKQMDLLRTRTLDQLARGVATGDKTLMKGAARDMFKYTLFFGGSVQGINWFKDWMLGREVEWSDRGKDYFMNLAGIHRIHINRIKRMAQDDRFKKSGLFMRMFETVGKTFLPPLVSMIDEVALDIENPDLMREESYGRKVKLLGQETGVSDADVPYLKGRFWRFVPFFGRDVFWTVGLGKVWEAMKHRKGKIAPIKPRKQKVPEPLDLQ